MILEGRRLEGAARIFGKWGGVDQIRQHESFVTICQHPEIGEFCRFLTILAIFGYSALQSNRVI